MTYGLESRASAAVSPASADPKPASGAWRTLDEKRRLALIEYALRPANDLIDAYPIAL